MTRRLVVALLFVGLFAASGQADEPRQTGFIEIVETKRLLLDIEVTDEEGRPIPGLTKDDFELRMNMREWPIESVDDFCQVEQGEAVVQSVSNETNESGEEWVAPAYSEEDPVSYAIFFQLTQMDPDTFNEPWEVIKEAQEFASALMANERPLAIVAYGRRGFETLADFGSSRQDVLSAIEAAFEPRRMEDPRIQWDARPEKMKWLSDSRDARQALEFYVSTLESMPGRKAIVANYGRTKEQLEDACRTGDCSANVRRVAYGARSMETSGWDRRVDAAATTSRASVFHDNPTLGELITQMESSCRYQLSVRPPKEGRGVRSFTVFAQGRRAARVDAMLRDQKDRWHLSAQRVMVQENRSDFPVLSSLVPKSFDGKKWTVELAVAFPSESLLFVPTTGGWQSEWGVGALLSRDINKDAWDLERFNSINLVKKPDMKRKIYHHHVMELTPGFYDLRSYVGDTSTSEFGGHRTSLTLPRRKDVGIAGPALRLSRGELLRMPLAEEKKSKKKRKKSDQASELELARAPLPLPSSPIKAGRTILATSFVCPGEGVQPKVRRTITYKGKDRFEIGGDSLEPSGPCYRLEDVIELPASLAAGQYGYRVVLTGEDGEVAAESRAPFEIASR